MSSNVTVDIAIFGGGVAGLWLLNRLQKSGFTTVLFESGALGGGQTHKSQGIIHGGMKYALQGMLTHDARAMQDMPEVWQACLQGRGEIDLSAVPVLSNHQYLWSPNKFTAKLTGFLAGATLHSKVGVVKKEDYPLAFQHPQFKGEVSALDELVLDIPVLVRELVKANQNSVYKIEPLSSSGFKFSADNQLQSATVYQAGKALDVQAQLYIFAAGAGNECILKHLGTDEISMQRRPLHMVMVKTPFDLPLYAHCLGLGARPRLTITTHHLQDGSAVWYLGGLLAEEGVERDEKRQIKAAYNELMSLFPWLDFSQAEFATVRVDRAEPLQKNGQKPESTYCKALQNMLICWPTKLALAPKLATDVFTNLTMQNIHPKFNDTRELRAWPMPPLATPIWEEAFCKNVT